MRDGAEFSVFVGNQSEIIRAIRAAGIDEGTPQFDAAWHALAPLAQRFHVRLTPATGGAILVDDRAADGAHRFGAGHVTVGISNDETRVVLQLPSEIPVATVGWLEFSPSEARGLANLLVRKADEART